MPKNIVTKHAKKRMRQRGLGSSRTKRTGSKGGRYQGKGVYKKEVKRGDYTDVVVYKKEGGKKVILSAWKKK